MKNLFILLNFLYCNIYIHQKNMAQNYLNAIRYKSNEVHLLNTHENYKFEKIGNYLMPAYQRVNMVDLIGEASIAPQTSLPTNAFTGSVYVDFEIPRSVNILKSCVLAMQIDNTHQTKPLCLPPISQLINRVEYYSGSTLIETILSTHLYLESVLETTEKLTILESSQNIDPYTFDHSSNAPYGFFEGGGLTCVLMPTQSKTYYLKLNGVLNSTHLFIPGLKSEIRIRVYFENYNKWRLAPFEYSRIGIGQTIVEEEDLPPAPSMRKIEMRLQTIELAQHNYNKLMATYRDKTPLCLRWLDRRYQTISMSTTSQVTVNNVLSAINGMFSHFFIVLRKQNAKGKENYDFLPIDELWFANASGSNLHGGIQYNNSYLRSFYVDHTLDRSTVFVKKRIYPILFCQDYYATYNQCVNTGTMHFTSSEQLYIKPGVTDQVELGVYGYAMATMVIRNGLIEIAKS